MSPDVYTLPEGLPVPEDDGGADHLPGPELPLYKRITLVPHDARLVKIFYPVFPPDANAGDVLRWLRVR